jgi:hypothetical protein
VKISSRQGATVARDYFIPVVVYIEQSDEPDEGNRQAVSCRTGGL